MTHFVTLATNKYYDLGVRFAEGLNEYFRGGHTLHLFVDRLDPLPANTLLYPRSHKDWRTATNDKFNCMGRIGIDPSDYVYYVDADTRVYREVCLADVEGELVGFQHFNKGLWCHEPNVMSAAHVPVNTPFHKQWFMGAMWGGRYGRVKAMCAILQRNQESDWAMGYEPGVNDESHLNHYFHYNPPTRSVEFSAYPFKVSDKGGAGCLRT